MKSTEKEKKFRKKILLLFESEIFGCNSWKRLNTTAREFSSSEFFSELFADIKNAIATATLSFLPAQGEEKGENYISNVIPNKL